MAEIQYPQQTTTGHSSFVLPPHSNKMAMSIICTLLCCLVGGIIAIIYSSKSNSLYNSALYTSDDTMKQNLYYQSESSNKTAQTWITICIISGVVYILGIIILVATGVLASVLDY